MSSSHSRYPSDWSAWAWSDRFEQYERYREVSRGQYEYEYSPPAAPAAPTEFTPRNKEADPPLRAIQQPYNVTTLTDSMGATSLNTYPSAQQSYQGKGKQVDISNSTAIPEQQASSQLPRWIKKENTKAAKDVDRRFKVHRSNEFLFGKVFKVLWSEPVGGGGTVVTEKMLAKRGKEYSKVRPFLIVDTRRGHSICLPILTYGGRGLLKPGVHPDDHAVLYSSKSDKPYLQAGEWAGKEPIRVEIDDRSNKLDPMSRLNYSKLFTIEHNVEVFFIGQVAPKYQQQVVNDYRRTHPPLADRPFMDEYDESSGSLTQGAEGAESEYTSRRGQGPSQWAAGNYQAPARQIPTIVDQTTYSAPAITPSQSQGQFSGGQDYVNYDRN